MHQKDWLIDEGPVSTTTGKNCPKPEIHSESDSSNSTRKKRFSPKVKSGCMTCKKRRIKCDETKPTCRRCQAAERKCEYQSVDTWLFEGHDKHRSSSISSDSSIESLSHAVAPYYGTAEEKQYLDSFLRLAAPWLSRYSMSLYGMPEFFSVLLPQSSWKHPALRHSLVAVAMATEEARLPAGTVVSTRKNWHYYQAMRSLSSDLSVSPEVTLLASIMFWIHDNISKRSKSAVTHLIGALKIVNERRLEKKSRISDDIISSQIEPTLIFGLMFSAATMDQSYFGAPAPDATKQLRSYLVNPKYTHSHTNMHDIREELILAISVSSSAVKRHLPDENGFVDVSRPTYSELRTFLERWYVAFSRVQDGVASADKKLLECHYICQIIVLDCYEFGANSEELKDWKNVGRFEYVIDQMESLRPEELIQAPLAQDVHLALIPPLTVVARLCPKEELKARAIKLLKNMDRLEGLWHSAVAADLLERMDEIHEKLELCSWHESALVLTSVEKLAPLPTTPPDYVASPAAGTQMYISPAELVVS